MGFLDYIHGKPKKVKPVSNASSRTTSPQAYNRTRLINSAGDINGSLGGGGASSSFHRSHHPQVSSSTPSLTAYSYNNSHSGVGMDGFLIHEKQKPKAKSNPILSTAATTKDTGSENSNSSKNVSGGGSSSNGGKIPSPSLQQGLSASERLPPIATTTPSTATNAWAAMPLRAGTAPPPHQPSSSAGGGVTNQAAVPAPPSSKPKAPQSAPRKTSYDDASAPRITQEGFIVHPIEEDPFEAVMNDYGLHSKATDASRPQSDAISFDEYFDAEDFASWGDEDGENGSDKNPFEDFFSPFTQSAPAAFTTTTTTAPSTTTTTTIGNTEGGEGARIVSGPMSPLGAMQSAAKMRITLSPTAARKQELTTTTATAGNNTTMNNNNDNSDDDDMMSDHFSIDSYYMAHLRGTASSFKSNSTKGAKRKYGSAMKLPKNTSSLTNQHQQQLLKPSPSAITESAYREALLDMGVGTTTTAGVSVSSPTKKEYAYDDDDKSKEQYGYEDYNTQAYSQGSAMLPSMFGDLSTDGGSDTDDDGEDDEFVNPDFGYPSAARGRDNNNNKDDGGKNNNNKKRTAGARNGKGTSSSSPSLLNAVGSIASLGASGGGSQTNNHYSPPAKRNGREGIVSPKSPMNPRRKKSVQLLLSPQEDASMGGNEMRKYSAARRKKKQKDNEKPMESSGGGEDKEKEKEKQETALRSSLLREKSTEFNFDDVSAFATYSPSHSVTSASMYSVFQNKHPRNRKKGEEDDGNDEGENDGMVSSLCGRESILNMDDTTAYAASLMTTMPNFNNGDDVTPDPSAPSSLVVRPKEVSNANPNSTTITTATAASPVIIGQEKRPSVVTLSDSTRVALKSAPSALIPPKLRKQLSAAVPMTAFHTTASPKTPNTGGVGIGVGGGVKKMPQESTQTKQEGSALNPMAELSAIRARNTPSRVQSLRSAVSSSSHVLSSSQSPENNTSRLNSSSQFVPNASGSTFTVDSPSSPEQPKRVMKAAPSILQMTKLPVPENQNLNLSQSQNQNQPQPAKLPSIVRPQSNVNPPPTTPTPPTPNPNLKQHNSATRTNDSDGENENEGEGTESTSTSQTETTHTTHTTHTHTTEATQSTRNTQNNKKNNNNNSNNNSNRRKKKKPHTINYANPFDALDDRHNNNNNNNNDNPNGNNGYVGGGDQDNNNNNNHMDSQIPPVMMFNPITGSRTVLALDERFARWVASDSDSEDDSDEDYFDDEGEEYSNDDEEEDGEGIGEEYHQIDVEVNGEGEEELQYIQQQQQQEPQYYYDEHGNQFEMNGYNNNNINNNNANMYERYHNPQQNDYQYQGEMPQMQYQGYNNNNNNMYVVQQQQQYQNQNYGYNQYVPY